MGLGLGLDTVGSLIAGKPDLPSWMNISPAEQQTQAIQENTASLPALETLAGKSNQFNINQIQSMLNQVIPGYSQITSGVSSDIASMVGGKIPTDVSQAVQNSAAAQSLTGGFGGTGLSGNLVARDLGQTSLGIMNQGISSAQSWLGAMNAINAPAMFNMSSMFMTPQQQFAETFQNQAASFQDQYVNALSDYQHSIGVAGAQDLQDTFGGNVTSLMGSIEGSNVSQNNSAMSAAMGAAAG